jgi:membrane protease subunit HflC
MKRNIATLIVGVVLALVFILILVSYRVRETEVAVLLTFEKPVAEVDEPGFHLKWPWPIQKVELIDRRVRIYRGTFEQTQTQDGKTVVVRVHTGWRPAEGRAIPFREQVGTVEAAEGYLGGIVESQKNAVLRAHPLSDLISVDPEALKLEEIETQILDGIRQLALNEYGVDIVFVGIEQVALPDSVTQEVFNRMREERNRMAERYRAEGRREAEIIRATAESERTRTLAEAESEAKVTRGKAEASAAESFGVYTNDLELAIFIQKLDALEEALKERATVVFDADRPPFDLLQEMPETREPGNRE